MMNIVQLLQNAFDPTHYLTGFVDNHSQMVLSLSKSFMGVDCLSPRGLVNLREPLTAPSWKILLQTSKEEPSTTIGVQETKGYPWGCRQTGIAHLDGRWITASSTLFSPAHNLYVLTLDLAADQSLASPVCVTLEGAFTQDFTATLVETNGNGVTFSVRQTDERNDRFYNTVPDFVPCWRISPVDWSLAVERRNRRYTIRAGDHSLAPGCRLQWVIEVENRPPERWGEWPTESPAVHLYDVEAEWAAAQARWEQLLTRLPGWERGSIRRELRAAAVLNRCGYRGRHGRWGDTVASFALVTSWASTAFFWDSVFGALGLAEFDLAQAEDALRTLFQFQRSDGCCPTNSYEHMVGSAFYPQAPIVSWAMLRMARQYSNWDFVRELLPKVRALFEWNARTQDQDGDGLLEVRFSGQLADNAPQYDRYISHVNPHPEVWNIFLPPVASVALNSFHYMDARCQAELCRGLGLPAEAEAVVACVRQIPQRLEDICWDEQSQFFHDYDHQIECFNRARVLTSFLPIWAGMPLEGGRATHLIEQDLLNPARFNGEYPFPYLAYDEPEYTPQGYWRGRVWPHTATWILELLWQQGYHREADEAANRLLAMMNQREEILENYFSSLETPGGGSPDYQWSSGTYLYLANRRYRATILDP